MDVPFQRWKGREAETVTVNLLTSNYEQQSGPAHERLHNLSPDGETFCSFPNTRRQEK